MDTRLQERLTKWHSHIDKLKEDEENFDNIQLELEILRAGIFLKAEGNNAEREAQVSISPEVVSASMNLNDASSEYNHSKRQLEVKIKAFEAEYLTYKIEAEALKKYPKG